MASKSRKLARKPQGADSFSRLFASCSVKALVASKLRNLKHLGPSRLTHPLARYIAKVSGRRGRRRKHRRRVLAHAPFTFLAALNHALALKDCIAC